MLKNKYTKYTNTNVCMEYKHGPTQKFQKKTNKILQIIALCRISLQFFSLALMQGKSLPFFWFFFREVLQTEECEEREWRVTGEWESVRSESGMCAFNIIIIYYFSFSFLFFSLFIWRNNVIIMDHCYCFVWVYKIGNISQKTLLHTQT